MTQEPNQADEGLNIKAYIRDQSTLYIERIKSDIECCKVSAISMVESMAQGELKENHDNSHKSKMWGFILDQIGSLEVICYAIERICDRFEICEQSTSDCFHAKHMLDSAIRVYRKLSWDY